jgi:hypothetical protein
MFEFETENEYDVLIHTRLQTRSCSVARGGIEPPSAYGGYESCPVNLLMW